MSGKTYSTIIFTGVLLMLGMFTALQTRCTFTDCVAKQEAADDCTLGFLLSYVATQSNSSSSSSSSSQSSTFLLAGLLVCDALVPSECRSSE